jgi:hypothetical protein
MANEVPLETARMAAKTIYLQMVPPTLGISTDNFTISEVFTSSQDDKLLYYVFNIGTRNGFVIIAGQDNIIPVLGYSFIGEYRETGHAPAYNEFMDFIKKQIIYAIDNNLQPTIEITKEWERLINGEFGSQKSLLTSVGPLTETKWGQGCYYNSQCPECYPPNESCLCDHTAVGCVATAMGQVMRYHEYPDHGNGDTTYQVGYYYITANFQSTYYQWSLMPVEFEGEPGHNGPLALYHCGASVGMQYDVESSAFTYKVPYALMRHFNYAATAKYLEKEDYENQWINMLKSELDEGRPLIYRGSGHAWVCDGYDSNDYFYMNWGWNGIDNGLYQLNYLHPQTHGGDYGYQQAAVFKIQPPTYITIPYTIGFETGLDEHWIIRDNSDYGRILVTSNYSPHSGSYHLTMDANATGHYSKNEALLHLNLSGQNQVNLEFWWKEFNDEPDNDDGIYFSNNGGISFVRVHQLIGNNGSWQKVTLDVDQLASAKGLTLNSVFVIKFQQYDNDPISSDGFAFDDINVFAPPNPPDLMILSQNVSPWTVSPGSSVTASCIVKNQGTGTASSSTLKYFLSNNTTISGDDVYLGYDPVCQLTPGGTSSESEQLTIPIGTEEGLWYVLFYADANNEVSESNENNNVSSFRISVLDMGLKTLIYPNPADGSFTIKLPVEGESSTITIYNIKGIPVKEIKAEGGIIQVTTEDFESGQYIVQIHILNQKIIKQINIK